MGKEFEKTIIGYSGFLMYEECYEYNEDGCYLAESRDSAIKFMTDCGYSKSDFRVDEIYISNLIDDYGCSSGEYAMEELVFERFKKVADENELKYTYKDWYMDPSLKVIKI